MCDTMRCVYSWHFFLLLFLLSHGFHIFLLSVIVLFSFRGIFVFIPTFIFRGTSPSESVCVCPASAMRMMMPRRSCTHSSPTSKCRPSRVYIWFCPHYCTHPRQVCRPWLTTERHRGGAHFNKSQVISFLPWLQATPQFSSFSLIKYLWYLVVILFLFRCKFAFIWICFLSFIFLLLLTSFRCMCCPCVASVQWSRTHLHSSARLVACRKFMWTCMHMRSGMHEDTRKGKLTDKIGLMLIRTELKTVQVQRLD